MTTSTKRIFNNGDEIEIRTNAGAAPIVFINGILQERGKYRVYLASDGLPNIIENKPLAWKSWFAWRPVTTISGNRVWLKKIYRARGNDYDDRDNFPWYHYADLFEVLQNVKNS